MKYSNWQPRMLIWSLVKNCSRNVIKRIVIKTMQEALVDYLLTFAFLIHKGSTHGLKYAQESDVCRGRRVFAQTSYKSQNDCWHRRLLEFTT